MSVELLAAAEAGDTAKVQELIAAGAELGAVDAEGATALHLAAQQGHLDTVKALIAAGADVNAKDNKDWTPIFKAAYNHEKDCGYAQVVQALVDAGGDVNARIYYGLTPLMLAAGGGEAAVCEVLLKGGAEVKATNDGGRTALAMVKERFFVDVINLLHDAEGYVMETGDGAGSGGVCGTKAPGGLASDVKVVNFMKRPMH
jgi:ankyrin repeat protein